MNKIDYFIEENPDGTFRLSVPRFDDDDIGLEGIRSFPSREEAELYASGLTIQEDLPTNEQLENLVSGDVPMKAVLDPTYVDDGSMGHRPKIILVPRS
jgi:hypothetical protein